jgi:hypothetical protein
MELGKSLLAFMTLEFAPELKSIVEDLESLLIITRKLDFLPELIR